MIEKEAKNFSSDVYHSLAVESAREGLLSILGNQVRENPNSLLLMPAYIGWSPNEGSGLMDPVLSSSIDFQFYNVNEELEPVTQELDKLLTTDRHIVLLLVHYFGRRSILPSTTISIIKDKGHTIIEDWAHDLSRFFEPRLELCDDHFEIFSIHKWTASKAGGLVRGNIRKVTSPQIKAAQKDDIEVLISTNIHEVFRMRWENFRNLDSNLISNGKFRRFWSSLDEVTCPLNYPIVLKSKDDRSELYEFLTEQEIHPTALYHKLTDKLNRETFPDAYFLADRILNLPVHQDCSPSDISELVTAVNLWALG